MVSGSSEQLSRCRRLLWSVFRVLETPLEHFSCTGEYFRAIFTVANISHGVRDCFAAIFTVLEAPLLFSWCRTGTLLCSIFSCAADFFGAIFMVRETLLKLFSGAGDFFGVILIAWKLLLSNFHSARASYRAILRAPLGRFLWSRRLLWSDFTGSEDISDRAIFTVPETPEELSHGFGLLLNYFQGDTESSGAIFTMLKTPLVVEQFSSCHSPLEPFSRYHETYLEPFYSARLSSGVN